jgi:hypothetical protein
VPFVVNDCIFFIKTSIEIIFFNIYFSKIYLIKGVVVRGFNKKAGLTLKNNKEIIKKLLI